MSSLTALVHLVATGALLQLQLLPWTPDRSTCFTADTNLDGRAEVCILDGQTLHVYGRLGPDALHTVTLPPRTSAVDIADLDGDGTADLIVINGEDVLRFRMPGGHQSESERLFSAPSQYSRADGNPFPAVLVVDRGEGPLIALPGDSALELRTPGGALVDAYPIGIDAPFHVALGKPFSYWVNQHSQTGAPGALEIRVASVTSYKPLLPDGALPIEVAGAPAQRMGSVRQQWDARAEDPETWPWFPIATEDENSLRALYRKSGASPDTTQIRVRSRVEPGSALAGEGDVVGPPRMYPGTLILDPEIQPDFNGDDHADLVLWKSPRPALTADGLARAVARRRWPLHVTTHAFLPEKNRFSPVPQSLLKLEIPLAWFMAPPAPQGPLRAVILRDFNGDKKTDLAAVIAEDTIAVWQAGEKGLIESAVFERRFDAPIDEIVFQADLEGNGSTTLALRTGNHLALLRPASKPASP